MLFPHLGPQRMADCFKIPPHIRGPAGGWVSSSTLTSIPTWYDCVVAWVPSLTPAKKKKEKKAGVFHPTKYAVKLIDVLDKLVRHFVTGYEVCNFASPDINLSTKYAVWWIRC